eukprot:scaffold424219_cov21-Prasinocladus_malaysianus.AAC.1
MKYRSFLYSYIIYGCCRHYVAHQHILKSDFSTVPVNCILAIAQLIIQCAQANPMGLAHIVSQLRRAGHPALGVLFRSDGVWSSVLLLISALQRSKAHAVMR